MKNKLKENSGKSSEVNVAKLNENESYSSTFSLSITLSICNSDAPKWLFHMGVTYQICPRRKWFSSLEKLDSGVFIKNNDAACQMVGIGTIQIKVFDGVIREFTDVRCSSDEEEHHLSWSCGVERA